MAPLCWGSSFCPMHFHLLGVFIPHPLWPLLDNGSKLSLLQREGPTGDNGPMEVQGTEGRPSCLRLDQFYGAVPTPELLIESGWWQAPGETKPLLNIFTRGASSVPPQTAQCREVAGTWIPAEGPEWFTWTRSYMSTPGLRWPSLEKYRRYFH